MMASSGISLPRQELAAAHTEAAGEKSKITAGDEDMAKTLFLV
jgi:hypothetical protein